MITFYFHIGQAKTGTSAIQSFLNHNRKLLATKYSVLYPNFDEDDFTEGDLHNHGHFFKQTKDDLDLCILKFNKCFQYASNCKINSIIISFEGFEWEWWPALIAKIVHELKLEYKIILYLRQQDTYLEAAWKQWGHKIKDCNNIHEFKTISNLQWLETAQRWLNHLDKRAFIVKPYEKKTIGTDVVKDFLATLNINDISTFSTPESCFINENHGLTSEVIEILRLCSISVDDPNNHGLLSFVYHSLPEKFKKAPMEPYQILSPIERIQIIEEFTPSNNKLAEIFWGKGIPLFSDPLPDINAPWEKNSELTLDKVIPILMEILISQSKKIEFLKQQNQNLPTLLVDHKIQSNEMLILKNQIKDLQNSVFHNLLFCSSPKEIFQESKFNQQISVTRKTDAFLEIIITGEDPQIILPAFRLSKRPMMLIIDLTSSIAGKAQIYFLTSRCKYYIESNSIISPFPDGRNPISFIIHEHDLRGRLRLDFEQNEGAIQIHSICGKN
jgi:hypothetical protein